MVDRVENLSVIRSTDISHCTMMNGNAPDTATGAILKPSDPVPTTARPVSGINFDSYEDHDITVKELVAGMANMGFQASAVADAVRIINDMVSSPSHLSRTLMLNPLESMARP